MEYRRRIAIIIALLTVCAWGNGAAQQSRNRVAARTDSSIGRLILREVVVGLDHPWAVAPLPDGSLLITERPGRLWYVTDSDRVVPVEGLPDLYVGGQGGLLDVIVRGDADVYLSYSARRGLGAVTAVSRGRLAVSRGGDGRVVSAALVEITEIFSANKSVTGGRHFGSRLAFGPDDTLYITLGERGNREEAQDATNHLGTVVRINRDGTIPRDNPDRFLDPADRSSVVPAPGVFSWGHRNAQGIARDPQTGAIWLNEHGPKGGDEINIVEPGKNYGWPLVTAGVEYSGREISEFDRRRGYEPPVLEWTPSIAPSGLVFIDSPLFPEWRGDLFVGALAGQHLRRVDLDAARRPVGEEVLFPGFARIRDVRNASDGTVYVLTDESPNGGLYRLERRR